MAFSEFSTEHIHKVGLAVKTNNLDCPSKLSGHGGLDLQHLVVQVHGQVDLLQKGQESLRFRRGCLVGRQHAEFGLRGQVV